MLHYWGILSGDWHRFWGGCHSARRHMRNGKYWTYCSYTPGCILTTKPERSALVTIISWHVTLHLKNVSVVPVNGEYGVRTESRFTRFFHCYVTWCPLTTGFAASQYPSWRDAVLARCYHTPLVTACLNVVYTVLPQSNIFTTNVRIKLALVTLLLTAIIARISHFMDP